MPLINMLLTLSLSLFILVISLFHTCIIRSPSNAPTTILNASSLLDISLHLNDLHDKTLKAKVITTFAHNGLSLSQSNASSTIVLNAEAFQHVQVSGASFSYDGHRIQLKWDTPFAKNEQRKVTIEYTITHPTAGLYFQNEDSIIGAQPSWVITDHETEK